MKLKWPGFNAKGTVIIELEAETFCIAKNTINVLGKSFIAKDEFHVTLIGTQAGLIILDKIKYNKAINKLLEKTFESIDWSFKQAGSVNILSRKKGRALQKSIIMLLEMPGVAEFYRQLRTAGLFGPETPVPPAHVTLFTYNCPLGIGVSGDEVLKQLTVKTLPVNNLWKA